MRRRARHISPVGEALSVKEERIAPRLSRVSSWRRTYGDQIAAENNAVKKNNGGNWRDRGY